jgi:hypothetical protein
MSTPTVPGATTVGVRPANAPGLPAATVTPIASKRGRKPGSVAKERKQIPLEEFVMEQVAPETAGYLRRQRIERSREQEAVDRKVMAVKQAWQDAGEPDPHNWPLLAKLNLLPSWLISKDLEEDALFMLSKGATLHGLKLIVGKIQYKSLPDLPLPPGKVRIPFIVVSRKIKDLTPESPAESTDSE